MVKKQGSRPIVPKGVVPAAAAGGAAQPRRDGQPSSLQLKKQQHHAHPNGSAKHAGTPQQALHTQQQQGGRQQGAGHGVHKPARHHPLAGPSSDGDAERPHKKPRWSGPGADGTQVAAAAHGGMATQQQQQQSTSGQHQHQHHHQHHHRHHHYHHKHHGHAGGQKDEQTGRPAAAAAAGGVAAPGAAVTAPAKPVAAVNGKGTAGVGPSVAAPAGKPAAPKAAASAAGPAGSNWAALKHAIGATGEGKAKAAAKSAASAGAAAAQRKLAKPASIGVNTAVTHVVALDCEMVGVGSGGGRSALARVCIVNDHGNVLLDSFVKPKERVTDYRTAVSGVRPSDLAAAISFDEAQAKVDAIFKVRHGHLNARRQRLPPSTPAAALAAAAAEAVPYKTGRLQSSYVWAIGCGFLGRSMQSARTILTCLLLKPVRRPHPALSLHALSPTRPSLPSLCRTHAPRPLINEHHRYIVVSFRRAPRSWSVTRCPTT